MNSGVVIRSTGSWYNVLQNDGTLINCRLKGKFRTKGIRTTNPIAVGDIVTFSASEADGTGMIESIKERKNYIIRKAANLHRVY